MPLMYSLSQRLRPRNYKAYLTITLGVAITLSAFFFSFSNQAIKQHLNQPPDNTLTQKQFEPPHRKPDSRELISDTRQTPKASSNNDKSPSEFNFSDKPQKQTPIQGSSKQTELRLLMEDFYYPEEKDRISLLDKISRLAPEVGIDEDLLTLLDLAAHDSNAQIEQMAREIRDDLIRVRDNILQPAEELISQLREIDTLHRDMSDLAPGSDEITTDEIPTLNDNDQHSSDKIAQKKHALIGQLAELASNSEDFNQRDYALNHLAQINHDAALEVIQHHLLTNDNAEERYLVIEKLSAAIGDINSIKLRQTLEIASNDAHTFNAEYAKMVIETLDVYEKNILEHTENSRSLSSSYQNNTDPSLSN